MKNGTMTADEGSLPALAAVFEQMPAPMRRLLLGLAKGMQAVAHDHAETVAKVETEVEARRCEVEALATKTATLNSMILELGNQNRALEQEASSHRVMNAALLDERTAFQAMESAVAHFADRKRRVDVLLQAANADEQDRRSVPHENDVPHENEVETEARDAEAPVDAIDAVSSDPDLAAGRDNRGGAAGEPGTSVSGTGSEAGSRRIGASSPISG